MIVSITLKHSTHNNTTTTTTNNNNIFRGLGDSGALTLVGTRTHSRDIVGG